MRLHFFISTNSVLCVYTAVKKVQHLKLSLWRSIDDDHPLFGIHSFCRGNLEEGRQPAFNQKKKNPQKPSLMLSIPFSQVTTGRQVALTSYHWDSELHLLSITHLDWGSGEVWQMFDVLALFSDDGSHCKCRDEQMNRLRFLGSLLGTNMLVLLWPGDHTVTADHLLSSSHQCVNADSGSSKNC